MRSVVAQFAIAGVLALLFVGAFTAYASRRVGTEQAIDEAKRVAYISSVGLVAPALSDDVLAMDTAALDRLDRVVRGEVIGGSLVRVKIWDQNGTIVYSDEPRLIGERFLLSEHEREIFTTGRQDAEVSDLSEPENRFETESKLLEVYSRTETREGTPLLFEAYFRYSGVTEVGRHLWSQFAPITIGALVVLQLVQMPLAWSMARRVQAGQRERERLLRQALEASDVERRRIASDLHDGVVQELTGVSLTLAAYGRGDTITNEQVLQASDAIRDSIKSLRSLLIEIYPPNLQEEGLRSAIADLLSGLGARGIATKFDARVDVAVDPDAAALVYRSAQEALRNVVSHAAATHVRVELHATDRTVRLIVDDDGRGFAGDILGARAAEGHVGLRSLSGLIAEVGGTLDVRSAPGAGTRVDVSVPTDAKMRS